MWRRYSPIMPRSRRDAGPAPDRRDPVLGHPGLEIGASPFGEPLSAAALVADTFGERVEEPEVRVHRREIVRVRLAQIAVESTEHRRRRRDDRRLAADE